MIRVVHLISALDVGGAERQLCCLAKRSDRRTFHHSVVSMTSIGPAGVEMVFLYAFAFGRDSRCARMNRAPLALV